MDLGLPLSERHRVELKFQLQTTIESNTISLIPDRTPITYLRRPANITANNSRPSRNARLAAARVRPRNRRETGLVTSRRHEREPGRGQRGPHPEV